uniref:Uncharacterized protein n=1 Tax=viral metagenome TaxID=1070528 RepID=A0A6C0HS63_9ZZZZ
MKGIKEVTKICRDCKFYMGTTCKKFYDLDIVTGEKSYYYAKYLRENEKCGESAIHFETNHYKLITLPYYCVKNNAHIVSLFGGVSLYLYAFICFVFNV